MYRFNFHVKNTQLPDQLKKRQMLEKTRKKAIKRIMAVQKRSKNCRTGKKLLADIFSESVGNVFKALVLRFGRGLIFFLDAFVDFFAVHRNAFRGLYAKLDMTAVEVDHLDDDVIADPNRFA
jgi:hypothetical protein